MKEKSKYTLFGAFGFATLVGGLALRVFLEPSDNTLLSIIQDTLPDYALPILTANYKFISDSFKGKEITLDKIKSWCKSVTTLYLLTEAGQYIGKLSGLTEKLIEIFPDLQHRPHTPDYKDLIAYTDGGITAYLIGKNVKPKPIE